MDKGMVEHTYGRVLPSSENGRTTPTQRGGISPKRSQTPEGLDVRVAVSLTGQAWPEVSGVLVILLLGVGTGYTMAGTKDGKHLPASCR